MDKQEREAIIKSYQTGGVPVSPHMIKLFVSMGNELDAVSRATRHEYDHPSPHTGYLADHVNDLTEFVLHKLVDLVFTQQLEIAALKQRVNSLSPEGDSDEF